MLPELQEIYATQSSLEVAEIRVKDYLYTLTGTTA